MIWLKRGDRWLSHYVVDKQRKQVEEALAQNPALIDKLAIKFADYVRNKQAGYTFDLSRGIRTLEQKMYNDVRWLFDNKSCDTISDNEILKIVRAGYSQLKQEVSEQELFDILERVNDHKGSIVLLKHKYVSPEEIGRDKHSGVADSSFWTYYYYQVEMTFAGHPVSFIQTYSSYYSGGWN